MSKSILWRRRGRLRRAGAALGRDTRLPRILRGHLRAELDHAAILGNPALASNDPAMQDLFGDPTRLYFVPGISDPLGPDIFPPP